VFCPEEEALNRKARCNNMTFTPDAGTVDTGTVIASYSTPAIHKILFLLPETTLLCDTE
jgi:hypothetical protein